MGCWSESCAISGLEIGANLDAVVMFVKPVKEDSYYEYGTFCQFVPVTAPTYGVYSDYGDIEEDDPKDSEYFLTRLEQGRRMFDPNEDSHTDYMNRMWWCRRDVWDFCDNLKFEFSYGDRPKTIGEAVSRQRHSIMEYVNECMNPKDGETEDEHFNRLIRRMMSSRDVFGIERIGGDFITNLKIELDHAIEKKNHDDIANMVEASLRIFKLSMIGYELRKIVCPSTRIGPQHGGYDAIAQLSTFTLTKCQEHFAEYGEED